VCIQNPKASSPEGAPERRKGSGKTQDALNSSSETAFPSLGRVSNSAGDSANPWSGAKAKLFVEPIKEIQAEEPEAQEGTDTHYSTRCCSVFDDEEYAGPVMEGDRGVAFGNVAATCSELEPVSELEKVDIMGMLKQGAQGSTLSNPSFLK
jgi:hypothetical protein